jgi:hypothetical protein
MCVIIFPLIHFSINFTRYQSITDIIISLTGIATTIVVSILLLFGSLIANPEHFGMESGDMVLMLVREAILDYDCAGSNVWVYMCLHFIPSFIVFIKVLTD